MTSARRRRRAGCAAALLLPLLAACRGGGEGGGGEGGGQVRLPRGTPIVLVSIDTLRSDHLPAYGYGGVQTPAIDRLRRDGVLFERAYSPVPLTLPAHASMLTGLLPAAHGIRDNLGYQLAAGVPYLPRLLREQGYATGGAVSAFVLRGATGLRDGFDFYEDRIVFQAGTDMGGLQRPGAETLSLARDWLRGASEGPCFFFLHLYEPHTPYTPPAPYASRHAAAYDGEIAAADAVVGELLAELDRLDLYDRALVVLVSDHGEGLGDHGEAEHGLLLYRESLQVPLLLKLPRSARAGGTVGVPAHLVDITPTVLSLLGMPVPEGPGKSLLALGESDEARPLYAETFYPRLHFGWSELTSLVRGRFQLIDGPRPELYDVVADPAQRRDVLREERRQYAELREALAGYDRELVAPAAADEDAQAQLAALGYLGSVGGEQEGPLANPKDRLHVIESLKVAYQHLGAGRPREAIADFRRVLAEEPRLVDAWEHLGQALVKVGEREAALEAYREALRLSGGSTQVALSAASVLMELGRLDEARQHAELAATDRDVAYDLLAQIALKAGDLDEAQRQVERAMATRETRIGPLVTQAQLALARDRPEEALRAARAAITEFGDRRDVDTIKGLYFYQGQALARLGQGAEAASAFRREIELFPNDFAPYSHLALLLALEGDQAGVASTLRQLVEANPSPSAYAEAVRTLRALGDPSSARRLLAHARGRWPESVELRGLAG